MTTPVYSILVADKCPDCGGPMRAVYYRVKGLAPWVHCWRHWIARSVTRDEYSKFMTDKIKGDK